MHSIVSQRIQQGLPTTIFFLLFVANTTLPTYNSIVKSTVGQIDEVATLKKKEVNKDKKDNCVSAPEFTKKSH